MPRILSLTPARFLGRNDTVIPGERKLITVPNPAAAADWSIVVPGGRMWRIIGGNCQFAASATVANRFPGISLSWQGFVWWLQRTDAAVVASATVNLGFGLNVQASTLDSGGTVVSAPTPDAWIPDTTVVASSTGAIAAADQYSLIAFVVEEVWVTDNDLTFARDELERWATSAEQAALSTITGAAGEG